MSQAGKTIYLVGNWKSNKTLTETMDWLKTISLPVINPEVKVVICPPFPFLIEAAALVEELNLPIELGVQDISPFPFGAYTGEVTASMVKGWGKYVIVGHSERRKYFHETDQEVTNKVNECLESGLTPIVCVDEPYLESQIEGLRDLDMTKMIIAYEPVAAIGSGHPDTPEHAQMVAERIKAVAKYPVPVLYGGSANPQNIKAYVEQTDISGSLVGGASLDPEVWQNFIEAASSRDKVGLEFGDGGGSVFDDAGIA